MSYIMSVKNLTKSFDGSIKIIDNVSLDIVKGERIVLCGPSGSGKSTFIRCLNLLEKPTSGSIFFEGQDITSPSCKIKKIRSKMCMVFQQFNLFSNLSILDNIILAPVKLLSKTPIEAKHDAFCLLEKIGLQNKVNSFPHQLSGGQKQRIAIVRALAMKPSMMLFDEPTSALDPSMTNEVQNLIYSLSKDNITMVIITHNIEFAKNIATKSLYLEHGKLLIS